MNAAPTIVTREPRTQWIITPAPAWGSPFWFLGNVDAMEHRASRIATASAQDVVVSVVQDDDGDVPDSPKLAPREHHRPYATYRLKPGRHRHQGRNHLPDCPVMRILSGPGSPG